MNQWRWINLTLALAVHDRQISEHAGGTGTRDLAAVESALARPQNLAHYESPDAASLAASYLYGIAKNHGFVDGNKRTAWVVARLFLADNGFKLVFDPFEAIRLVESVAGGSVDEPSCAQWFRERLSLRS